MLIDKTEKCTAQKLSVIFSSQACIFHQLEPASSINFLSFQLSLWAKHKNETTARFGAAQNMSQSFERPIVNSIWATKVCFIEIILNNYLGCTTECAGVQRRNWRAFVEENGVGPWQRSWSQHGRPRWTVSFGCESRSQGSIFDEGQASGASWTCSCLEW